jgi:hypothetical protein
MAKPKSLGSCAAGSSWNGSQATCWLEPDDSLADRASSRAHCRTYSSLMRRTGGAYQGHAAERITTNHQNKTVSDIADPPLALKLSNRFGDRGATRCGAHVHIGLLARVTYRVMSRSTEHDIELSQRFLEERASERLVETPVWPPADGARSGTVIK